MGIAAFGFLIYDVVTFTFQFGSKNGCRDIEVIMALDARSHSIRLPIPSDYPPWYVKASAATGNPSPGWHSAEASFYLLIWAEALGHDSGSF